MTSVELLAYVGAACLLGGALMAARESHFKALIVLCAVAVLFFISAIVVAAVH